MSTDKTPGCCQCGAPIDRSILGSEATQCVTCDAKYNRDLESTLQELERTNPEVKAASQKVDRVSRQIRYDPNDPIICIMDLCDEVIAEKDFAATTVEARFRFILHHARKLQAARMLAARSDPPGEAPAADQFAHRDRTLRQELAEAHNAIKRNSDTAMLLHGQKQELELKLAKVEAQNEELLKLNERLRSKLTETIAQGEWAKRGSNDTRTGDEKAWDLFAASALSAIELRYQTELEPSKIAAHCAAYADALMAERAKRRGGGK